VGAVTASDTLTYREMQVLRLAAVGHSNKEIARRVGLGIKSVETYRYRACKKLMLHSPPRHHQIRRPAMAGFSTSDSPD
jgi:DNA-binding CsgD family transcriptional regulator